MVRQNKGEHMARKYYGVQVHTLTFQKVDANGESIDGKLYEYTGDHSSFCEGIDEEDLEEVSDGH
tara:strand:+ start:82 stop:276 length:195 start_codon:yes stop_codon:yes gene_type:complete